MEYRKKEKISNVGEDIISEKCLRDVGVNNLTSFQWELQYHIIQII